MPVVDLTSALATAEMTGALHLPYCGLTSIPPRVWKLSHLHTLDLGQNEITSVPPDIGCLTALEELWLNDNPIEVLPAEISRCASLRVLELSNTRLRKLPREVCHLTQLLEVRVDGAPLKAELRAVVLHGGTVGLLEYMKQREERRGLKHALREKLSLDLYHDDAARPDGAAAIAALVKSVFAEFTDMDQARTVIRNAERLFPSKLEDASASGVRIKYEALARDNARKQLSADVELCLRALYYDVIDPTAVEPVVNGIMSALPSLDDVQFLLKHAKTLFPANPKDISPPRLWSDLQALRQRLIEDRTNAVGALVTAMTALFPDVEPRDIQLAAANIAQYLRTADQIRALASDATGIEIFPSDFTNVRAKRIVKAFEALQAEKGMS